MDEEKKVITNPEFIAAMEKVRGLKKVYNETETEMKSIKSTVIQPYVETNGKFKDESGYARMQKGGGGFSVDSKALHKTATIWSESDDPTLQSCGRQILAVMLEKDTYQYGCRVCKPC